MNSRNNGSLQNKNIATRLSPKLSVDHVLPASLPRINQRSQKPEQNMSNPRSYLLDHGSEHGRGESSSYIVIQGIDNNNDNGRSFHDHNASEFLQEIRNQHEINAAIINLRASDYIRRFHERIDSTTSVPEDLPLILPPPPIIKFS